MRKLIKNNGALGGNFRVRQLFVVWHRWFGLFAALWLMLMAITGSIIVFYTELDKLLNPEILPNPTGEVLTISSLVRSAEVHKPGSYVSFINLPKSVDTPASLSLRALPDSNTEVPRGTYLLMDPYNGEVLTERIFGSMQVDRNNLMDFIYQLHIDLQLGHEMIWFLGLVSFLWLIDHFAALFLSFPTAAKWAKSFKIRRKAKGHRFVFDLHRAGSLWLFPVTLMLAFSGVYLNWYEEFTTVAETVSPVTHRYNARAPSLEQAIFNPPVTYDEAIQNASERAGADVDMISYFPWKGLYLARTYDERDIDPYGRRLIAIDARDGRILDDFHAASGTGSDILMVWQYPLHSGKAFGWTGRLIVFFTGIAIVVFSITGILLWSRKRRSRVLQKNKLIEGH